MCASAHCLNKVSKKYFFFYDSLLKNNDFMYFFLGEIFFQVRGRAFILERESKKLRRFAPNLTRMAGSEV
jgi:hypothetical protein